MGTEKGKNILILCLAGAVIFLAGVQFNTIRSQGVGGRRAPVVPKKKTVAPDPMELDQPYRGGGGSAGAAGDLIAVTGDYGVGTSVLYVIDAKRRALAVYEARGGSKSARRLLWIGTRQIGLDLLTQSYNDESDISPEMLRNLFKSKGWFKEESHRGKAASGARR